MRRNCDRRNKFDDHFLENYKIPKKSKKISESKSTGEETKKYIRKKPQKSTTKQKQAKEKKVQNKAALVQTNSTNNIVGDIMKSIEIPPPPHPDSQMF